MRAGKGVDVVENSHLMRFYGRTFDHVLCLEMLEHDDDPFRTVSEMARVVRDGGGFVVTVPGLSFPRHDYPSDYWRFTTDGVRVLFRHAGIEEIKIFDDMDHVYAYGKKIKQEE
jgi:SAM-dependent methyltransferase